MAFEPTTIFASQLHLRVRLKHDGQYSKQLFNVKFADDWIRTGYLWFQKQSLYQLWNKTGRPQNLPNQSCFLFSVDLHLLMTCHWYLLFDDITHKIAFFTCNLFLFFWYHWVSQLRISKLEIIFPFCVEIQFSKIRLRAEISQFVQFVILNQCDQIW